MGQLFLRSFFKKIIMKTAILIFLGAFFVVNGINHFYNEHTIGEYAKKRGLFSPPLMVKTSGILLIFGGLSMIFNFLMFYGIIGLSLFLIIATFTIHRFWDEKDKNNQMHELMHFLKNLAILAELIYLLP